jgi:thioredoxin reductase
MASEKPLSLDVAVIGGGPAGISASLELSKSSSMRRVALFECDEELGGMPRSCHVFFGMRDRKRLYTGPAYARKLDRLVRNTPVQIHTGARVLDVIPGDQATSHRVDVLSPQGLTSYESRFVLLATGCFESSRSTRLIPGARPSGIYTTGTLQQLVNLHHLKPGRRAVIVGSEHVAFSSVLTLWRAGVSIAAMLEEGRELQTYPWVASPMSRVFGFPIYKRASIKAILGNKRVEGIELRGKENQEPFQLECDTVVITGRFRPDSSLIDDTSIEQDPFTLGPKVDMNFMTSVPNIFAAGNVLRGADMHDLCALEGRLAARSVLKRLDTVEDGKSSFVRLRAERPIRYVVPQEIAPPQIQRGLFSKLFPWPAIQLERTLINPVIEALSGKTKIWKASFRKLTANTRIPLPVEKFDWDRVDSQQGLTIRVKSPTF